MQDTNTAIADRVRGIAAKNRATQTTIATILGIQRSAVNARMNAKVAFTAPEISELSSVFHEDIAAFFPPRLTPTAPVDSPLTRASAGVSLREDGAA